MISIILTTYNRLLRLNRAIESVLIQKFKIWELIIVNDGSTDKTQEIVEYYKKKDSRIRSYLRSINFGNDTRPKNEGIQIASSAYIAFLDDDNEYKDNHLETLWKNKSENPNYDVYYADRMIISENPDLPIAPFKGESVNFDNKLILNRNFIDISDTLIKKDSLYTVGGFDERCKKYIDWNLWVRMSKAGMRFYHIPKVITNYYISPDSKGIRLIDKSENIINLQERIFKSIMIPQWNHKTIKIVLPYLSKNIFRNNSEIE